jgi:ABC-type oligopeptide transport system substrate-binding subunit
MMNKSLVLAGSLLVACAVFLAACAEEDSGQGAASGGSPTTVAPTTSAPTPTTSEVPRDQIKVLVTGTVQEGVEPGCLILDTGKGQRYVLLSQDKSKLKPGAKVEVVGVRAPGQISYCQQGQPLEVLTVRAAS